MDVLKKVKATYSLERESSCLRDILLDTLARFLKICCYTFVNITRALLKFYGKLDLDSFKNQVAQLFRGLLALHLKRTK
jgi:hypothetical protein